jgi:hypothetical protein
MAEIHKDHQLREALDGLDPVGQRLLGARFAYGVIHLSRDERVNRAIEIGMRANATPGEIADAFRAARARATSTYTDCGKDTDWLAQADHFVAASAAAALAPDLPAAERGKPAWKAAVQARMAANCQLMESDEIADQTEAQRQYAIASEFLR